jgi:hypothetical protein
MLKLTGVTHVFQEKYQLDLPSVLILEKPNTGITMRGYVHRLVNRGEKKYIDGKCNVFNDLGGVLRFLKRKLASKCGITKQKLFLYLAEYVWGVQSS